jgi:hypothetical protein
VFHYLVFHYLVFHYLVFHYLVSERLLQRLLPESLVGLVHLLLEILRELVDRSVAPALDFVPVLLFGCYRLAYLHPLSIWLIILY